MHDSDIGELRSQLKEAAKKMEDELREHIDSLEQQVESLTKVTNNQQGEITTLRIENAQLKLRLETLERNGK